MERDYFLDAQQALEMGLVDKVLTSREEQEKVMEPLKGATSEGKDGKKGGDDHGTPSSPAAKPSPS